MTLGIWQFYGKFVDLVANVSNSVAQIIVHNALESVHAETFSTDCPW